jgi:hypothetical protein
MRPKSGFTKLETATWAAQSNHGVNRLNAIADIFEVFGIGVHCWKNRGNGYVGEHSTGSMHYRTFGLNGTGSGRAFDSYISPIPRVKGFAPLKHASGNAQDRLDCAIYIRDHLTPYLTEGIFNSGKRGYNLSVKNGKAVPASTWSDATWEAHRDHIHIAV